VNSQAIKTNSRTRPARQHIEEVNHILIFREDRVVIEVNVIARRAFAACKHIEEINHILIFREDLVVVEVNVIARSRARARAARRQRTLPVATRTGAQRTGQAQARTSREAARTIGLRAVCARARRVHTAERTLLIPASNRRSNHAAATGQAARTTRARIARAAR
jgi:hypothetical protein